MSDHKISFCKDYELAELMNFINENWMQNHVLAKDENLMRWQHFNKKSKMYNYVIAKDIHSNKIVGILGFIPTNHFDNSIKNIDTWLSIWKVRNNSSRSGLGLELLSFLVTNLNPRIISGIGLSDGVINLYKFLGYKVGTLNHYYIANERINDFSLIVNPRVLRIKKHDTQNLLVKIDQSILNNNKLQISSSLVPQKSIQYFESRYSAHPIYNYKFFGVKKSNKIVGVIVLRKVFNGSNSALRVVDFLGEPLALNGLYSNFQKLLNDNGSEYIDCYNYGIDESRFYNAGFTKRTKEDNVIIPNYYEPFEKRNVDLHFAFKCDSNYNFVAFKGDSDQDRPNLLGVEQ